jgi:C4-type Zn-finger protein
MVLTRLAGVLDRLAGTAVRPNCPVCGAAMVLRREDTVGELPFVVESLYVCERCGRHVTRVQPWTIPD